MAKKTFKGRVVLPGEVSGEATVSRAPLNTSGSYMENMFGGRTEGILDGPLKVRQGRPIAQKITYRDLLGSDSHQRIGS